MEEDRMISGGLLSALAAGDAMQFKDVTVLRGDMVDLGGVSVYLDDVHLYGTNNILKKPKYLRVTYDLSII